VPGDLRGLLDALKAIITANFDISLKDAAFFVERIFILLTSCDERRFGEWENVSWWDFIEAGSRGVNYRRYLARGLTRTLVAMRAEEGSTRTVGYVLIQLVLDLLSRNDALDRVLDGPTSDVWIEPWLNYLRAKGVDFRLDVRATAVNMGVGQIQSVDVEYADTTTENVVADYYVMAMPKERLEPLVTPAMTSADPSLGDLHLLKTEWMNGLMFYLKDDLELVHGHTIYVDTPWALTSISQQQFWETRLSDYGDGTVRGILSIDISDWTRPGLTSGKAAWDMTSAEDVKNDVWQQLKESLNDVGGVLRDDNVVDWYLDESITFTASGARNSEPLLVNTKGSWQHRPEAVTRIPNLFLASDYVRTFTDLATMEGANEAARRATNGILEASGSTASPCPVWSPEEPRIFEPLKRFDKWRWDRGKPHILRPGF
jgi:uncharacterized protein with NAD-binding domain and iron-sulfur cluster